MDKMTAPQQFSAKKSNVISLEKGKLPPQAVDLEEVVLGAMMIDKKGVDEIIDILSPDAFYKNSHKLIFEAIHKLFENTEAIDLLTVSSQLKKDEKLEVIMSILSNYVPECIVKAEIRCKIDELKNSDIDNPKKFAQQQGVKQRQVLRMDASSDTPISSL